MNERVARRDDVQRTTDQLRRWETPRLKSIAVGDGTEGKQMFPMEGTITPPIQGGAS